MSEIRIWQKNFHVRLKKIGCLKKMSHNFRKNLMFEILDADALAAKDVLFIFKPFSCLSPDSCIPLQFAPVRAYLQNLE